jgi:hypothetical protein
MKLRLPSFRELAYPGPKWRALGAHASCQQLAVPALRCAVLLRKLKDAAGDSDIKVPLKAVRTAIEQSYAQDG